MVANAEHLPKGPNARFVVTSLGREAAGPQRLYEELYCARGDMENRIKEQQLDMFADRTSEAPLRANQLRLYFASFAYVLMHGLRRLGLAGTRWANAQCGTLRARLLKVAARLRVTARKVWLSFSPPRWRRRAAFRPGRPPIRPPPCRLGAGRCAAGDRPRLDEAHAAATNAPNGVWVPRSGGKSDARRRRPHRRRWPPPGKDQNRARSADLTRTLMLVRYPG